jgi:OmpA-OmpF porin, OOP family
MRILVIGFVVFVIWSFFSSWLYINKILPVLNESLAVQTIPEEQIIEIDSLIKKEILLPKDLMIFFEFDKVKFKPDPQIDIGISKIMKWMEKYPPALLTVTGHADFVGKQKYNFDLGLNRAMSFKSYLEGKGIPSVRIITYSEGELKPIGDNDSKEGRAMNRRAEIKIKMQ